MKEIKREDLVRIVDEELKRSDVAPEIREAVAAVAREMKRGQRGVACCCPVGLAYKRLGELPHDLYSDLRSEELAYALDSRLADLTYLGGSTYVVRDA